MNNRIWTKEELQIIRKAILRRTGLFFNEENNLSYDLDNKYNPLSYQDELIQGINDLLNITNKEEIDRVLTKYSQVDFDSNNKLHYGLISTLSKIDLDNNKEYYTQIFVILKEIICQYERIITEVAERYFSKYNTSSDLKERIKLISDNKANNEINEINMLLLKTFNDSLNIDKEEMFKNVIEICNSKIKQKLIIRANNTLRGLTRDEETNHIKDATQHKKDFNKRYRRGTQNTRKKYHGGYL